MSRTNRKQQETSLEAAVREIGENLAKLTARLVGDEKMQTKGLVHEVSEARQDTDRKISDILANQKTTGEVLLRLNTRMETVEQYQQRQDAINKEIDIFREAVEKKEAAVSGGWKTLCTISTVAATFGGGIVWVIQRISA